MELKESLTDRKSVSLSRHKVKSLPSNFNDVTATKYRRAGNRPFTSIAHCPLSIVILLLALFCLFFKFEFEFEFSNCNDFSECVKLRDPYCAWDKRKQKCVVVGSWSLGANLFQSVATGVHESCPDSTHGKSMVKSPPSRDNNAGYVASSASGVAEASLFNADFPAPASSSSSSSSSTPSRGGKSFATHSHVAEIIDADKDDGIDADAGGMDPNLDLDEDDLRGTGNDGPRISPDESQPKYTVETLAIAVAAGSLAALFLGFVLGYCCGRKCRKNEEDNMPYPDTEYEYFEQRQNCHMRRYTVVRDLVYLIRIRLIDCCDLF